MKLRMKKIAVAVFALSMFCSTFAGAEDAARIFRSLCSPCHGVKGEGKKSKAPSLKDSQFIKNSPAADVKNTIMNGRDSSHKLYPEIPNPMPPRISLKDEDMDALVTYLKTEIAK